MKTLIFTNQKGGVGKSVSAVSVASGLSLHGFRTLLVDVDPQGHATIASGILPDEEDLTTYEVLKGTATAAEAIRSTASGYDLIATDIRQSGAELELASAPGRDFILREALEPLSNKYDFVIIDSAPSLNIITLMALTAADHAVVTLKADYLSLQGVAQLRDTIDIVKRRLNPKLSIIGILLTFYNSRKNISRQVEAQAEEVFGSLVFDTKITQAAALEELPASGQSIFEYKPKSKSALQYMQLTEEIISRTTRRGRR